MISLPLMKTTLAFFLILIWASCDSDPAKVGSAASPTAVRNDSPVVTADALTIMSRKEIPVLCYHNIRDHRPGERESIKVYTVEPHAFRAQMKMLADSGYKTITPDEYYAYLTQGAAIPAKPVMISFDDTDEEQYSIGAKEMEKYGFRGVYFIMTISIGRPRYMSKEQIKDLSDKGHVIATHTWDHHKVTEYTEADWEKQLTESKKKLETITGKKIRYFAYPFGLWKPAVIPELQKRDISAAFQLYAKRDSLQPLHTLRRMIVSGTWDLGRMQKWMKINFH